MSTVLISGGAGFIGSHLSDHLLKNGYSVRVLDNFSSGKKENISHLIGRIEILHGDITDYNDVRKAVLGCDVVVHLAAIVSVAQSFNDPVLVHNTNVIGTLRLLKEAEKSGVKKFIFASSCAVYGDNIKSLSEDFPLSPLSSYALSKQAGEQHVLAVNNKTKMCTIVLRFFNVFGPKQDAFSPYAGVIASFANKMLRNESIVIYGDGKQTRDFIYVSDIVQAISKAIIFDERKWNIMNVATGKSRSIIEVAESMKDILGFQQSINYSSAREGDICYSRAEIERIKQSFDFKISVPFKKGLEQTIDWYKNQISCAKGGAVS